MNYLLAYIGGGLAGWVIDTAYRSGRADRFQPGTLVPFFSLAYGTAGLALYVLFYFWPAPFALHVAAGTALCVLIELGAGIISLRVLGRRLWDYRSARFNYLGHIDLLHSAYWLFLTVLYRALFTLLF